MQPDIEALYRYIDVLGVFLMGVVGGTIARQKHYDIIGFLFLALFSALGGGMVRDVLIGEGPPAAVAEPEYLLLAFAGAFAAWLTRLNNKPWRRFEAHADAIISGSWAVTGATKALSYDLPIVAALFMGVLTATGGGMIRDVVTGEQPRIFGGNNLTAIPALLAALVCSVFYFLDLQFLGMILGLVAGAGLAIASYWLGWILHIDPSFAPVNVTYRQLNNLARRAREKLPRLPRRTQQMDREEDPPQPDSADAGNSADPEAAAEQGGGTSRAGEPASPTTGDHHEVGGAADTDEAQEGDTPRYSLEELLRALHEDETPAGRRSEHEFIGAWLKWQEERRRESDTSGR